MGRETEPQHTNESSGHAVEQIKLLELPPELVALIREKPRNVYYSQVREPEKMVYTPEVKQSITDQPPFSWLASHNLLPPDDFFLKPNDKESLSHFLYLMLRYRETLSSMGAWTKKHKDKYALFAEIVSPVYLEENQVNFFSYLKSILTFFRSFPYFYDYIDELWTRSMPLYDTYGRPVDKKFDAPRRPSTYAAFALNKVPLAISKHLGINFSFTGDIDVAPTPREIAEWSQKPNTYPVLHYRSR
jgi:hypothetical protein